MVLDWERHLIFDRSSALLSVVIVFLSADYIEAERDDKFRHAL